MASCRRGWNAWGWIAGGCASGGTRWPRGLAPHDDFAESVQHFPETPHLPHQRFTVAPHYIESDGEHEVTLCLTGRPHRNAQISRVLRGGRLRCAFRDGRRNGSGRSKQLIAQTGHPFRNRRRERICDAHHDVLRLLPHAEFVVIRHRSPYRRASVSPHHFLAAHSSIFRAKTSPCQPHLSPPTVATPPTGNRKLRT